MSNVRIHLIGKKTRGQIATHQALAAAAAKNKSAAPAASIDFDGFSGRGVELRELDPVERDRISANAAKRAGQEATAIEIGALTTRECVKACIVQVTAERRLLDSAAGKWVKITQVELEDADRFKELFSAKDYVVLASWFRRHHEITVEDLDAIEGNAVEVAPAT